MSARVANRHVRLLASRRNVHMTSTTRTTLLPLLLLSYAASAQVQTLPATHCGPQSAQIRTEASSPIAGEPMALRTRTSTPATPAIILLSAFPPAPIGALGCPTIYLGDPFLLIPTVTDGTGDSLLTMTIPVESAGAVLAVQPLVLLPGPQFAFGDATRITVRAPELAPVHRPVGRVLAMQDYGLTYAYAPCVTYESGVYHMFYCSGRITPPATGDIVRYSYSNDGRIWSPPQVAVQSSGEVHCCDPHLVYFQSPGDLQPYFYLFYSGLEIGTGYTCIFVARSGSIAGPFLKWTARGTWEQAPGDPRPVIRPVLPADGATQFSVVAQGNQLLGWWTDTTLGGNHILHARTTSVTSWPTAQASMTCRQIGFNGVYGDMVAAESEVRHDTLRGLYVMNVSVITTAQGAMALFRQWSEDGINWSRPRFLVPSTSLPTWGHNAGFSGNRYGQTIGDTSLVVYGAPSNPPGNPRGWWDLHASAINPAGATWNDIPWGWSWGSHSPADEPAVGDWDGDGKADRAIVNRQTSAWYVMSSASQGNGVPCIPWGWTWNGMNAGHRISTGDFDGDGRRDRSIVDLCAGGGQLWYALASGGGCQQLWWSSNPFPGSGCPHIPVPADFDGDGRAEPAIVWPTPSGPTWWGSMFWNSGVSVPTYAFVPAIGDYDGDGRADRAWVDVGVPNSWQRWYCLSSSGAPVFPPPSAGGFEWIGAGNLHRIVVGDYDGDGRTDPAVMNGTTGEWYLRTAQPTPIPWGFQLPFVPYNSAARTVEGDYDGDHKCDIAIALPDGGSWGSGSLRWYVYPTAPFRVH